MLWNITWAAAMWAVYLHRLPEGCRRRLLGLHGHPPHERWFLRLPFGLHPLPWHLSMLVTMATGVESGHLVHLSSTHSYRLHSSHNSRFRECILRVCFVCDDLAVMRGEARDHWDLTTGSPTNWPTIWIETTALLSALAPSFRLFSPAQPASRHAPHLPKYSSLQ